MSQSSLNFKDRFGLDYLSSTQSSDANKVSGKISAPNSQLLPGMEAVLKSVGDRLLTSLKERSDQTSNLLDMTKMISMRWEAVLPIVQYLAEKGLIERVAEDPSGNDAYKLTLAGQNVKV